MNLVIDIGNTRTKISLFDADDLVSSYITGLPDVSDIEAVFNNNSSIRRAIISSTRDYPAGIKALLNLRLDYCLELDQYTRIPVVNLYKTPETLGKDRLAAVVGASLVFPAKNVLVIDAGTAITYDFINDSGEYLGGNISPGLEMRYRALHEYTGRLPLLKPEATFDFWGTSTSAAIVAGVQNGILYEIDSYIGHFKKIYKNLEVIFTGGDIKFFDSKLKNSFFVHSNLVATGLNRILEYNAKKL
jgi:type III pantothenate kinase